jgi:hypothetical protein
MQVATCLCRPWEYGKLTGDSTETGRHAAATARACRWQIRTAFASRMTAIHPSDAPEPSDLLALPVRACVAFAVRCALRLDSILGSLDGQRRRAARRATAVAAEYAGGKEYDANKLMEIQNAIQPPPPDQPQSTEELALAAAYWSIGSAWGAVFAPTYLSLGGRRSKDNGVAAATAAWAAKAAVAAKKQNVEGVWQDLNSLESALERREITSETPVPQSFFTANTGRPQSPPCADQPGG